jgi:hypothetical protein
MKSNFIKAVIAGLMLMLVQTRAFSQIKSEQMAQLLDYSRPGNNHALLKQIAGTWNFQDANLAFVKGTLVRASMFDGRFYSVEITGGKLQLPIENGTMKEDFYKSLQIEGYDNPRMKFVTISINNHLGSDIQMQTGSYNPKTKEFIYDWNSELIKGQIIKNRRIIKVVDNTHYIENYYEELAGKYVKVRELDFVKSEQ